MGAFLQVQRRVNPFVLPLARRVRPYGVLEHTGSRSGRRYQTPVVACRRGHDVIIPLPFSAEVDWCRNTLSAGRWTLRQGGAVLELGAPEVIGQATALPLFSAPVRTVVRLMVVRQFLRLRRRVG